MDAGLLLAGVSSVAKPPGAPPGKEIETPPAEAKNEFENVLKQAKGKSLGEVAEAEPNAQPQKLDSTEDTKPLQCEAPLSWVVRLGPPVLPPQQVVPTDALVAVSTTPSALQFKTPADLVSPSQTGVLLPVAQVIPAEMKQALNIVEVKAAAINVATPGIPTESMIHQVAVQPKLEALRIDAAPAAVVAPEGQEQAIELAPRAVVATAITTPTKPLIASQAETAAAVHAPALIKPAPKAQLTSEVTPEIEVLESIAEVDIEQTFEAKSDTEGGFSGQQQGAQPEVKLVANETSQQVEQSAGMTPSERKAVVHQLTQKIEALAVNSVRNEVTVRMEPAELGTVLITVARGVGEMTASLTATNEKLHNTLHEARNELAATLTAKTNSTVRVEVVSTDPGQMGSTDNSKQQPSPDRQPRQEAITKYFQAKSQETSAPATRVARQSTSLIDLEG